MSDCDINSYYSEPQCLTCDSSCSTCVNSLDCNMCNDTLCKNCESYGNCSVCDENARMINETCQCNIKFYSVLLSPGNSFCKGCNSTCEDYCTSYLPCDCNSVSFYPKVNVDLCCFNQCPAGYVQFNDTCVLFNTTVVDFTLKSFGNSTDLYGNSLFPLSSLAAPYRGFYFQPGNYSMISSIVLSYSFTVQLWVKQYSPGSIFSIGNFSFYSANTSCFIGFSETSYEFSMVLNEWSVVIIQS
jgi:hypothetical protein